MKPKRIILIRHGESEGNEDRTIYQKKPDHKLVLTAKGQEQADKAGDELKELIRGESIHYYISPHERSRETWRGLVVWNVGTKMYEDPRLREQDWGHLRSPEETAKLQKERYEYGTFYFRFPNGESGADVYDRVTTFLDTLHRDFQRDDYPDNAIIVTHGLTIRLFIMRWFHKTVEEFESWDNPGNCQYFIMQRKGNVYEMPSMPKVNGV